MDVIKKFIAGKKSRQERLRRKKAWKRRMMVLLRSEMSLDGTETVWSLARSCGRKEVRKV